LLKKFLFILPILFLVIIAGFGVYFYINLQGVCKTNCQPQVFVVDKGSTLSEVLQKLENEKIIKNAKVAKIYLKLKRLSVNIQAGDFKLNPQDGLEKIMANLQKGTLDFWVTIPEGFRAEQVAERVEQARTDSPSVIPAQAGILNFSSIYQQNEGYLFPDTYLIPKGSSDEDIVKIMKNNFYNKITFLFNKGGNLSNKSDAQNTAKWLPTDKIQMKNGNEITLQDLLILASLVEREAKNDTERPIIANIIYKRWKSDWPLQIDATIQYAVGATGDWWKKDLTANDLKIVSPYNTYLNKGLPPAPICNPGSKAIDAVINQTKTDYWYYSTGDDGVTRYTKTLEGHNQNVEQNIK
jgi:UPF0755 protein